MEQESKTNYGRSMVEMIAVLALGAMMTIGVVWGIRVLMRKHQANQIYDDIQQRVLFISSRQNLLAVDPNALIVLGDLDKENANRKYKIEAHRLDEAENEGAVFSIEISGITRKICRTLLSKPFNTPYLIRVGDQLFNPEFPDFSVCNVFEEASLDLITSTAYAATSNKGEAKLILSYRPDEYDPDNTGVLENVQATEESKECSKSGGVFSNVLGRCCLGGIASNGSDKHLCCESGDVKTTVIGTEKDTMCCRKDSKAFLANGNYLCCSDAVVNVAYPKTCGSNSYQKWCCPTGQIAYCAEGNDEPSCCTGTVITVGEKAHCCESGKKVVPMFNSLDQFCCSGTQKPYLTEIGPACCDGEPYMSASVDEEKLEKVAKCCTKDKVLVDVIGKEGQKECCPKGQDAYWTGSEIECRSGCSDDEVQVTSKKEKKCCPKVENCKDYNYSTCACKTCTSGYIRTLEDINNASSPAKCCRNNISGCSVYDYETCACKKCSSGKHLDLDGKCVSCPVKIDGCETYDEDCKCKTCESTSIYTTTKIPNDKGTACCEAVPSCKAYDENCMCKSCEYGYRLLPVVQRDIYGTPIGSPMVDMYRGGATVMECRKGVVDCVNPDHDTPDDCRCPSGYINTEGHCCVKMDGCVKYANKEDYVEDANGERSYPNCVCTECSSGYVLENGICVKACKKFDIYHGQGACTECEKGFVLNPRYASGIGTCERIPDCITDMYGNCTSCPKGFALVQTKGDGYGVFNEKCELCTPIPYCQIHNEDCSTCLVCETERTFDGKCVVPCTVNSECSKGEYCHFEYPDETTNSKGVKQCKAGNGKCRKIQGTQSYGLNWWSAKNFCEAQGYKLPTEEKAKALIPCLDGDERIWLSNSTTEKGCKAYSIATSDTAKSSVDSTSDSIKAYCVDSSGRDPSGECIVCLKGNSPFDCGDKKECLPTDLKKICAATYKYKGTCEEYKKWLECLINEQKLCACIAEDSQCK